MGRPQKTETNVTYEVKVASTAIIGIHYEIIGAVGTTTIAAGENIGYIDIDILDDTWNPLGATGIKDLTIGLTGGDLPRSKYTTATYRIRIN